MENLGDWERKNLINKLTQGRELANQLQVHLNSPSCSSSSCTTHEVLASKILASHEMALWMLNLKCPMGGPSPAAGSAKPATFLKSELPPSLGGGTPPSGDSRQNFGDQEHMDAAKKRKAVPRWTKQIRVSPGVDPKVNLDDGYS